MKNILYYCDDLDILERYVKVAERILRNLSRKNRWVLTTNTGSQIRHIYARE